MDESNRPIRNDWLTPSNVLALCGMLGMAFASYLSFQADTRDRVAKLEYRVDADEHVITVLQAANGDQGKIDNDIALRLDRLEHGR